MKKSKLKYFLDSGKLDLSKLNATAKEQLNDLKEVTDNFEDLTDEDFEIEEELLEYIRSTTPEALELPEKKREVRKQKAVEKKAKAPEKPTEEKKPEKPKKPALTKENCQEAIAELKAKLASYKGSKPAKKAPDKPVRKTPLAEGVKNNLVSAIRKVVIREKLTNKNVKPVKFKKVISLTKGLLKEIRRVSGGISNDNDSIITSFESDMKELLQTLEKKAA